MTPPADPVFEVRATELALLAGGALATLLALAVAIWLFLRASREERARRAKDDGGREEAGQ